MLVLLATLVCLAPGTGIVFADANVTVVANSGICFTSLNASDAGVTLLNVTVPAAPVPSTAVVHVGRNGLLAVEDFDTSYDPATRRVTLAIHVRASNVEVLGAELVGDSLLIEVEAGFLARIRSAPISSIPVPEPPQMPPWVAASLMGLAGFAGGAMLGVGMRGRLALGGAALALVGALAMDAAMVFIGLALIAVAILIKATA